MNLRNLLSPYIFWAVLGLSCRAIADEEAWLVAPQTAPELAEGDGLAREQLAALVERKQSPEFRKAYRVEFPRRSSGVGDKYRLLIYGKYIFAPSAATLEIHVAGGKATAELIDHQGIATGELDWQQVDGLTRQLAYAFQAKEEPREDDFGLRAMRGAGSASHVSAFVAEIIQTAEERPLHLRTASWQLLARDVDNITNGVQGFVHAQFCETLLKSARERLQRLEAKDVGPQVVAKLRKVSADARAGKYRDTEQFPVTRYERADLAAVEALLLSHLAIEGRIAEALPELVRLGDRESVAKLQIVTAEEPLPRLRAALNDESLSFWAQKYALRMKRPEFCELLVERLESLPPEHARYLAPELAGQPLTVDHLARIVALYQAAPEGAFQAELAGLLLRQTGEDRYFDALLKIAVQPPPAADDDYRHPRSIAASAIFDFSTRTGRCRKEAHDLLLSRLSDSPSADYNSALVRRLGKLGSREDIPRLETLAEVSSGYQALAAIEALTDLDPPTAVRKARQRIAAFADRGGAINEYSWNVSAYFTLLFWQNDRAAIEPLRRARSTRSADELEQWNGQYDPAALIEYLEATDAHQRARLALKVVKLYHVRAAWQRDVGRRLVEAGANREDCQALLDAQEPKN
jgi:hypothetical protein